MATNDSRFSFPVGFHYFCDHRCWRCDLGPQCVVYAQWKALVGRRQLHYSGPAGRVASVLAVSMEITISEASKVSEELERQVPAEDRKAFEDAVNAEKATWTMDSDRARNSKQDPIVVQAAEYAHACWPAVQALRAILQAKGELDTVDATDRLEEMCATIASKIFRAVSSTFNIGADLNDPQCDANGSAKVALLLIEESRQAWRELMRPGKAVGDGLPARFVSMLDAIEVAVLQKFPRAFEFIRPGFDTGEADVTNGQLARALRQPTEGAPS